MEQPPGHNKAIFAPEYVGVQHDADFSQPDESTDQTGGFSSLQETADYNLGGQAKSYEEDLKKRIGQRQFDYYRVTSFLIDQPNFSFTRPNAGGLLPKIFEFSYNYWQDIGLKLRRKHGFMELVKDGRNTRRSIAVNLNVENLLSQAMNPRFPFITDEMLQHLKDRLNDNDIVLSDEAKAQYLQQLTNITAQRDALPKTPEEVAEAKRLKKLAAHERWLSEQAAQNSLNKIEFEEVREVEKRARPRPRNQITPTHKRMTFDFLAEGSEFRFVYQRKKFAELDPMDKILLAIGNSATFATKSHQDKYVLNLINIGLKKKKQYNPESFQDLLESAQSEGLIMPTDVAFQVAKGAVARLRALKHDHSRTKRPEDNIDSAQTHKEQTIREENKRNHILGAEGIFSTLDSLLPPQYVEPIREARVYELEATDWLYPEGNQSLVIDDLKHSFDITPAALTRRIRAIVDEGYAEVDTNNGTATNIRLTKKGVANWKSYDEYLRSKEEIPVNIGRVELLDSLTHSCIELGHALEKYDLVQDIQITRCNDDYIKTTENDRQFIEKEIQELESILSELIKEHAATPSELQDIAA